MTLEYTIDEADFLTHQLYIASRSERIKRKRKRSRLLVPIAYLGIGLYFYVQQQQNLGYTFFLIGILWFFFYPLWERRHYRQHYKAFIKENYKERLGRTATLEISDDLIIARDNGNESKVLTTELAEINEIPTEIFIRLKGGQSFILPKNKMTDLPGVITRLKLLSKKLNIQYVSEEKWEWK